MTASTLSEPTTRTVWELDPSHSNVEFAVKHLMIATVRGRFSGVSGQVVTDGNRVGSQVEIEIDAGTVDTRQEARDEHLRSPDFFDVASFPKITFTGTEVEEKGDDEFVLKGDLTIRGVTRPVTLDVTSEGMGPDAWGGQRAGFTASTKIDRRDFGLTWNMALEAGGVTVGHDIKITIDAELVKKQA